MINLLKAFLKRYNEYIHVILPNELNGYCCIFLGTHARLNKIQLFSLRTKYVERVCNGKIQVKCVCFCFSAQRFYYEQSFV